MGPDEPERVSDQSSLKEEAYRRLRCAAQKYNVLQLGMTFAWVDNGKRSASDTHQPYSSSTESRVILCQTDPWISPVRRTQRPFQDRNVLVFGQPIPRLVNWRKRQDL